MTYDLKELMKLTMFMGRISDIHEKNFKVYPFVFIDGVDQAEISYQIATMEDPSVKSRVIYTITFKEGFPRGDLAEQIENLRRAICVLMQHSVDVRVFDTQGKEIGAKIESGTKAETEHSS